MNHVQRIDDVSPTMRSIISGTQMDPSARAEAILSRGSMGYLFAELTRAHEAGILLEKIPPESDFLAEISLVHSKLLGNIVISNEANIERESIRTMIDTFTLEFGKLQLRYAEKLQWIPTITFTTKGRVNVIMGSR